MQLRFQAQLAHGSGVSMINVYADMVKLRQEPSIQWGKFHHIVSNDVYFFVRQAEGFDGFLVAINFGPRPATVNFVETRPAGVKVPEKATVVGSTGNFVGHGRGEAFEVDTEVNLKSVFLKPTEGVIFTWKPEAIVE